MEKYFICLANSYNRGGRCIAGVEIISDNSGGWKPVRNDDGSPRWIRPIAKTTYGEIPNLVAERIKMLSLVKLTNAVPCPEQAHVENVYYSRMEQCEYNTSLESSILNQLIDTKHQFVFQNKGRAVAADMLMDINYSLMLIHPSKASAYRDENREKSKNRMKFTYYGIEYDFPITDPTFLEAFKRASERYADIPDVYLALSLGLEFEGWHHKLVAGVIIPIESAKIHDADIGTSTSHIFDEKTNSSGMSQNNQSDWFDKYEWELARLLDKKNEIEEKINEVRAKILQGMESHGLDKINSEQFSVSYSPTRTVIQFDSKAFRMENEELYSSYCKPKQREASIVVKRKIKE